jgi:16S rRNA U516 pseudouridylate synthase RsuA-like enzyme
MTCGKQDKSTFVYLHVDMQDMMTSMISAITIPPDMKLKKANIFLSVGHQKELRKMSRQTMIPVSALIRKAIAEFLERERKKKTK